MSEREKAYDLIINGISDIVVLLKVERGPRFRFIKVNTCFAEVTGFTEEQLLGQFLDEFFPKELAAVWLKHLKNAIETEKPLHFEEQGHSIDYLDVKMIPIFKNGMCTHIIAHGRDISEKKKLEEHLQQVEKLDAVGLLAGGIAHDFNNFLTIIMGNISLAKMKVDTLEDEKKDKLLTILKEVEIASHQAKNLTQQLLTFAKSGAPVLKTTSIAELLTETATFVLRGSNVRYEYSLPDDLWQVEADEGQIIQVIQNIIINADHAMPQGGVIRISADNIFLGEDSTIPLTAGEYVKITIEDNGVGMPREHLEKIFDPYFTTKENGNGLGLPTSYYIIEKHGGYITVESEQGMGTTFHIYLLKSNNQNDNRGEKVEAFHTGGGKILVMEDEERIRLLLTNMLNYMGYEVLCAKDATETVKLYSQAKESEAPFDAVIMDLTIPGSNEGKEALKKLMEIDANVNAIVSSGYANNPVLENFQDYGFRGVVAKPYNMEELGQILKKVVV